MKKLILCFVVSVLFIGTATAQDIIIKQNGEEVQSKVVEIGDTQIKYRKYSNLTGPIYTIASSDVFVVKFENGTREIITPADVVAQQVETPPVEVASTESSAVADSVRYAQVAQVVKVAKEPRRDKKFYIGVEAEGGFATMGGVAGTNSYSGSEITGGFFCEIFPNKYKTTGWGLGLGYTKYMFDKQFDLSMFNIDFVFISNPGKGKAVSSKCGIRVGVPLSAEKAKVDVKDKSSTTVGLLGDLSWSTKHFLLGGRVHFSIGDAMDWGSNISSGIFSVALYAAYRF